MSSYRTEHPKVQDAAQIMTRFLTCDKNLLGIRREMLRAALATLGPDRVTDLSPEAAETLLDAFNLTRKPAVKEATPMIDPDRAMKEALFACIRSGGVGRTFGGVPVDADGGVAEITFKIIPGDDL